MPQREGYEVSDKDERGPIHRRGTFRVREVRLLVLLFHHDGNDK